MEMNSLFWYKFQLILELLVIKGMFATKLRRRDHFVLRLTGGLVALLLIVTFFPAVSNFGTTP